MSRTTRYKLLYFVSFVVLAAAVLSVLDLLDAPTSAYLLAAILLLVPGRVNGYYWREFYRGRSLLEMGLWDKAALHFDKFLLQLGERPWLKSLIWFAWGFYTRDVEAMTYNNLGTVRLQTGDAAGAEAHWEKAIRLDPLSPLPFYNLALLAQARSEETKARELLARSIMLGYKKTTSDQLAQAAGTLLARIEGRPAK